MSWTDCHKEYEDSVYMKARDFGFFDFSSGQKFPSFPMAEISSEAFGAAQAHPSNRSSSPELLELQELTTQEPQVCF
jgi:hypothetical protein